MNNQTIECYWIMHGNLPEKRWKVRRARKGRDKQLLRLDRERQKIRKDIWNLGYEDLIPPVQRGWKRTFVLREDVMRDKRSEFYQNILNKINTVQYSYRKDFKVKKRRFRKRCYVIREQKLEEMTEFYFKKKQFTEEEQALFYQKEEYDCYSKKMVTKYVFTESWRFVLRVQANIITKVRRRDWELERREKEIGDYFEKNDLQRRLNKLYGYRSWRYWDKRLYPKLKYEDPLKNKPFHVVLDEYYNEL